MADPLQPQQRLYLNRVLTNGLLMRAIAGGIVFVSLVLSTVVLANPTLLLRRVMAEPNAKRQALEQYFNGLQPQTDLERELIAANITWNTIAWRLFLYTNIRLLTMFAAYLLCLGILTWFFSSILIKTGRLIQQDRASSRIA
jgi:hypothetical protein